MPTTVKIPLPGIAYAKATPENILLASSPTGGNASDLTNVINPITLATGKITTVQNNNSVTGIGTEFTIDFRVGDYLFAYDLYDTSPTLVGKISAIGGDGSLTLTEGAPSTIASPGVYAGKMNSLLSTQDNIIIRVPVVVAANSNTFYMPNWKEWLKGTKVFGSWNNEVTNYLQQFSTVGVPTQESPSPANIQYTITPYFQGWQFSSVGSGGGFAIPQLNYFPNSASIPKFVYALINPYGLAVDMLPANTLFKLFANQEFNANCIQVTTNYPDYELRAAGYFP